MRNPNISAVAIAVMIPLTISAAEPRRDLYGDPLPDGASARIGTLRLRNTGEITRLALSSDGKLLATAASVTQTIRIWDSATGTLIRELALPFADGPNVPKIRTVPDPPLAMAFTADASQLHVLTRAGTLRTCNLTDGQWAARVARSKLSGEAGSQMHGWASPDGNHFYYLVRDGIQQAIETLAVGTEAPLRRIEDRRIERYGPVSVSTEANRFAALLTDGAVGVWDLSTGKEVAMHRLPKQPVYGIGLSSDGKALAAICGPRDRRGDSIAAERTLYGWDLATGKESFRFKGWDGRTLTYSPDGKRLVSFASKDVLVADAATGKLLHRMEGHGNEVINGHAFGAGGKKLVTGSRDRTAIVWDLEAGKAALDFDSPRGPVDVLAFSPDGRTLFTGCDEDHTGGLWSADTGKRLFRLVADGRGGPLCATFTPDGRQVVVGYAGRRSTNSGTDWTARLWSVGDGKMLREFGGHTDGVHQVVVTQDGKHLATREGGKGVRLWDLQTGRCFRQLEWKPFISAATIAFPEADRLIAAAHEGDRGTVVTNLVTEKTLTRWAGGRLPMSVVISPDGKLVAVREMVSKGTNVVILDLANGAIVQTLTELGTSFRATMAFSPNGQLIAVTGTGYAGGPDADDAVQLFDVKSGKNIRTIRGHQGLIAGVAFSPDGKRLATGGWDSTALVWELAEPGK